MPGDSRGLPNLSQMQVRGKADSPSCLPAPGRTHLGAEPRSSSFSWSDLRAHSVSSSSPLFWLHYLFVYKWCNDIFALSCLECSIPNYGILEQQLYTMNISLTLHRLCWLQKKTVYFSFITVINNGNTVIALSQRGITGVTCAYFVKYNPPICLRES